ncbi:nitrilase-related carbon-nitrogen hydrolase [Phenylobacterium sp.]|uniref:nitrilase-related carbon-nitrogen hydrolase n=1 Tax=Phenylobacterium sp. TaxID=1871053 RepID=UPI003BA9463D
MGYLVRAGCAVLAGVMLAAAHRLAPVWPLAWIAPVFLLIAAFKAGPREALLLAFVAGALQATGAYAYYDLVTGPVVASALVVLFGLLWVGVIGLTRRFVLQMPGPLAAFAYPTVWAAMDLAFSLLSPHGSMGSIAYSQMPALPVIQVAALGGTAAIAFLISLPASALAVTLHRGFARPGVSLGVLAPPLLVCGAGLAFGLVQLRTPEPTGRLAVGLAVVDRDIDPQALFTGQASPTWPAYRTALDRLAGARLLVLPEAAHQPTEARAAQLAASLGREAATRNAYLLAGIVAPEGGKPFNRAWVFAPDGRRVVDYRKHHPAPGEVGLIIPGDGYSTFDLEGRRIGVAICKDLDFAALPRRYARMGVQALVVPASDFRVDGLFHARMAVLRGVEGGFTVIRAAEHGVLTVSDPQGRILSQTASRSGPGAILRFDAPIGPARPTVYAAVGDLFGWTCLVLVVLGRLVLGRRASPKARS